jgi:hypothetical protein
MNCSKCSDKYHKVQLTQLPYIPTNGIDPAMSKFSCPNCGEFYMLQLSKVTKKRKAEIKKAQLPLI